MIVIIPSISSHAIYGNKSLMFNHQNYSKIKVRMADNQSINYKNKQYTIQVR